MKIAITRLELTNFKCFRQKTITFSPDVTTISGRNGVGKTTIADAILWCLFGKNTQGQSDFDLKTHDSDGNPIPNLDHSVELTLSVVSDASPSEITLKRTLKETWIKKRGSSENVFKNNTTEYMFNGNVVTATDYKKLISGIISEDIFRVITNPSYFPSLKWQQQREFLTQLAGEVVVDENNTEFADLVAQLNATNEDIIAYRKHLSYQIKQVKNKLDMIPVRLEEQHKALPEPLDWSALEAEFASVAGQQKEVEAKIASIRSGNGDDVRKQELRTMLDDKYRLLRTEEQRLQKQAFDQQAEKEYEVVKLTSQFRQLLNDKRDLENTLPSFDKMTERCQETLAQCEKDAQAIREEWANNQGRHLHFGENESTCPTCGQPLPQEQIAEKRQKAEANLNADKARIKQELKERADKVIALRTDTEAELKSIEQKKADAEKNLNDIREQFNKVFSDKQKAEKEKESVPSYEFLKENSNTIAAIRIEIANLEAELQKASVTSEEDQQQLDALESQKSEYAATLSQLQSKLSSKEQYDKIQYLINGIKTEEQGLVAQLSELERKEDVAIRYQDRQNAILESRINQHFSIVQWRLFRTVNNGGDPFQEPYCECYVDGVAYHDGLNQAARLNAGLDIIATLCKHYNVSAPIVIDNSESTINILPTESQQIRLEVCNSELEIN